MDEVMIQGTEIQIKEYRGKRVVTFKDIDAVHQRPEGTAKRNFNHNRNRFISGVDFFKVSANEFRTHFNINHSKQAVESVTLITESGYLMLVKSFTDDLAWKVQRELVDTYFRVRDGLQAIEQTVTVTKEVSEESPDIYLEASKIMSGCLEGNRAYVLNILRHIVPDIDEVRIKDHVLEVKSETIMLQKKDKNKESFWKQGVDIDVDKLKLTLNCKHMTASDLAYKVGVCVQTADNWVKGRSRPVQENLVKICAALGESENYLTPQKE